MYTYETHLHTSTASACGKSKGFEYVSLYKELGYAGIIVTDHFFNGNCGVPKDLPWEERVSLFCKGYEEAKEEGDRQNFDVFFGWECSFGGDEFLVYGLDKQWLLDHPDILEWDHITHYKKIKESGGLVIQAHPFRERDYLSKVSLHPHQCDGWEVANVGNAACEDRLAYRYAKENNMIMTAGSDIHLAVNGGREGHFGVSFDTKLNSIQDYVNGILNGLGKIKIPEGRVDWDSESTFQLPTYLYDQSNIPKKIEMVTELYK